MTTTIPTRRSPRFRNADRSADRVSSELAPVDDGVAPVDGVGDTTDHLHSQPLVERAGRVVLEHQVVLHGVEAELPRLVEGVADEGITDALAAPFAHHEIAGVDDVCAAA